MELGIIISILLPLQALIDDTLEHHVFDNLPLWRPYSYTRTISPSLQWTAPGIHPNECFTHIGTSLFESFTKE
jgi:hypothetical protein